MWGCCSKWSSIPPTVTTGREPSWRSWTRGNDFPRLRHIWVDQGYASASLQWTADHLGIGLGVVYPRWRCLQGYCPISPMRWTFTSCHATFLCRAHACSQRGTRRHDLHSAAARPIDLNTGGDAFLYDFRIRHKNGSRTLAVPLSGARRLERMFTHHGLAQRAGI